MTDQERQRHESWMRVALHDAIHAESHFNERPFGCVIVQGDRLLARAWGSERHNDPTRHSEIVAIREACQLRGRLLHGCVLYSTHEPCLMCTGAILHSKVSTVVWGSTRAELSQLFRVRDVDTTRLLADTAAPPICIGGILRADCVALFDRELREAAA